MIRRLFEERFGRKQVIAVHTIRCTENAHYLCMKKDHYKRIIDRYRHLNSLSQHREMIQIRRGYVRNLHVDAERYYIDKLIKVSREWSQLK